VTTRCPALALALTVYGHVAEPSAAWLLLDPKNPGYYRSYPAWHVHGRPGVPSKEGTKPSSGK
jgi:hypothetical protein